MSSFAEFIKEWEADPKRAELLRQGREWAQREFYDQPHYSHNEAVAISERLGLPTDFPL